MIGESRPGTDAHKDAGDPAATLPRPGPPLVGKSWKMAHLVELVAVVVGMGAVFWEFGIERQRDRDLRNVRLHATVAELAGHDDTAATSPAVQKILGLMHRDGVDMTGISVPNVVFRMVALDNVDWSDSNMTAVTFTCAQHVLQMLRSLDARIDAHHLACARLRRARFHGADLRAAQFYRTDLARAEFFHTRLSGISAENTDFSYAGFVGGTSREHALPRIVEFLIPVVAFDCYKSAPPGRSACVSLKGVGFFGAQLPSAHFTGAEIADADFTRATLRGARFRCEEPTEGGDTKRRCTTVDYACFRDANLTNAIFEGVTIKSADFSGAVLAGALFENVTFDRVVFHEAQAEAATFDWHSRESLKEARVEISAFSRPQFTPCSPEWRSRILPWKDRPQAVTAPSRHPLFHRRG